MSISGTAAHANGPNGLRLGFGRSDITPRIGVELCGFGPFLVRTSRGIRDPLFARAMAASVAGERAIVVSCDLPGTTRAIVERVRGLVEAATGVPGESVMVLSTHTHSGPNTIGTIGWGEADQPYLEVLPARIARACVEAFSSMRDATLSHAEVPCEGIGQNREYDRDSLPLDEVLSDGWRPLKPELTDTTCHVLKAEAAGKIIGFVSYFGCHPVVCCQSTHQLHGDFCGVATGIVEREHPGSVGLFLQGAQGDVNSSVVHKPEAESLRALDIISARYAASIRDGLARSRRLEIDSLAQAHRHVRFSRKPWDLALLRGMLAQKEVMLGAAMDDEAHDTRMTTVYALALRRMVVAMETGAEMSRPIELHGLRIGPIELLASPFETFQATKNAITSAVESRPGLRIPLVVSFGNDMVGYAPDPVVAARGGYAADMVPVIYGTLPFARAHDELIAGLLDLDTLLAPALGVAAR